MEQYFHPRTAQGEIKVVPDAVAAAQQATSVPTLNSECLAIDSLVWAKVIKHEEGELAKAKIRTKFLGTPVPDEVVAAAAAPANEVIRGKAL